MKLEATARLNATQISARYTGTKTKDLALYLNSLVPGLRIRKPGPGGGPSIRNPARWTLSISIADAHALGSKLLKDGWTGKRRKVTDRKTGEVREFVMYTPADEEAFKFIPTVSLYKPRKGSDRVTIGLSHNTHAAIREREFFKVNRRR